MFSDNGSNFVAANSELNDNCVQSQIVNSTVLNGHIS